MTRPSHPAPAAPAAHPLPDPRQAWRLPLLTGQRGPAPEPARRPAAEPIRRPATGEGDTLAVDLHAGNWALLASALAAAAVPLAVGDVAMLRRAAKLDPDLVAALARWIDPAGHRPTADDH
ncbi:hypothetical protein [Kitasatospora sp. LaBMicrA B282]|uniref:hypothetical protein n=1 Tax=Kitasatospora sp. LaBMicrA B282 TaxID=3420949 RepID=UPI003D1507B0